MKRRILLAALAGAPLAAETPARGQARLPPSLPDLASLRGRRGGSDEALILLGYAKPGDGGGGLFVRVADDARSADNGITVIVDAGQARWRRMHAGPLDVRWAGARCDGTGDDSLAIARAAALGPILFPTGASAIGSDLAVPSLATVAAGATIAVAAGKTLRFDGGFTAPVGEVFTGPGAVAFDSRFFTIGHPEWWGALTNRPGIDCAPALNACIAACSRTQLQWADYHIATPVKIVRSGRVVEGVTGSQSDQVFGTRLVIDNGTSDGLQVGPDAMPKAPDFPQHIRVSFLTIFRAARVTPPSSGFAGPCGVRMQFVVTCYLDNVNAIEHCNGFYMRGVVHSYLRYCQAFRRYAGTRSGNDFFNGFFQDNSIDIGFASGNASLYYQNCSCFGVDSLRIVDSSGIYSYGGFTDTFISGFESAVLDYGLNLNGGGLSAEGPSSEDLTIEGCVLDRCGKSGIAIRTGNGATAVTIHNCYVALAGAGAAIAVHDTHGSVSISGCQIISGVGNTMAGLLVFRASGVSAQGNIYTNCLNPVVLRQSSNCQIRDVINNTMLGANPGAVWIHSSSRNIVECTIKGTPGINPAGVFMSAIAPETGGEAPRGFNCVGCSGIDPNCIAGGAVNKLVSQGVPITIAGPFGDHDLAFGIMD